MTAKLCANFNQTAIFEKSKKIELPESQIYPINLLRNVARNGSKTEYFLIADIEMEFSAGFERRIRAVSEKYLSGGQKNVLIFRRFEIAKGVEMPKTKMELQGISTTVTGFFRVELPGLCPV